MAMRIIKPFFDRARIKWSLLRSTVRTISSSDKICKVTSTHTPKVSTYLLTAIGGFTAGLIYQSFGEPARAATPIVWQQPNFFHEVYKQVQDTVVTIQIYTPKGQTDERLRVSNASGVVVSNDGIIVTNSHVVFPEYQMMVILNDKRSFEAKILAIDKQHDLALIKIDVKGEKLPSVKFDNTVKTGEWILTIGSPFQLSNSLSFGIVSAASRSAADIGIDGDMKLIQTDCNIHRGNSGGPLFNLEGNVIGLNMVKLVENISFAIPAEYIVPFIKKNRYNKPLRLKTTQSKPIILGVTLMSLSQGIATYFKKERPDLSLPERGELITNVEKDSLAERLKLYKDDVIIAVNGSSLVDSSIFHALLDKGLVDTLTILRRGKKFIVTIPLLISPEKDSSD